MTSSSPQYNSQTISFNGKKYNISSLSEDNKKLIEGLNIANAQIRMQEDSLKLMILGRSSLINKLKDNMKDIDPID